MGFYVENTVLNSDDLVYVPTPEDIRYLAIIVAEKIVKYQVDENIHFDQVVSIANGGDNISRLIAQYCALGNKKQGSIRVSSYTKDEGSLSETQDGLRLIYRDINENAENTLVIDDLSDTGDTLDWLNNELNNSESDNKAYQFATLWVKEGTKFTPDFYGENRINNQWIALLRESDESLEELEKRKMQDETETDINERKNKAYSAMRYLISKGIDESVFPDELKMLKIEQ